MIPTTKTSHDRKPVKTAIVWFRNDLRLHDHPALTAAQQNADRVIPLFIYNDGLLTGKHASANRNRFLRECLEDLAESIKAIGGNLVVRNGKPETVLSQLIAQTGASEVHYSTDYTPYARVRDGHVSKALEQLGTEFIGHPGRLVVDSFHNVRAANGNLYKVFSPFHRSWLKLPRRSTLPAPKNMQSPDDLTSLSPADIPVDNNDLSPDVLQGGETAGLQRLDSYMESDILQYAQDRVNMHPGGTSRLSAYLHFGCISPRLVEEMLPPGDGPDRFRRQLAWRDFYNYIILFYPHNAEHEFQERFRQLEWSNDDALLSAWQQGRTGYPIVDAGMRQLIVEGWMHNRARLIVGSFLTKDLQLDWRHGERHFMRLLLDGDEANNNGNWQWIASVGVDPAPIFRRLYNPVRQQKSYDPDGSYVRYYVPELAGVPDKYLAEPWTMSAADQEKSGCVIGTDYPAPIVDHPTARRETLDRFRAAAVPADADD